MKQTILINAAWVLVAGATFAIGRMSAGSGDGSAAKPEDGARRAAGLSSITESTAQGGAAKSPAVPGDDFLAKYLQGEQGQLSGESMAAAMREAMAETDPIKRSLMIAQLMQNLSPENVQQALAALRESPDRRENFQYMALLQYAWGKIDGEAAIAAAIETGGRGGGFGAMAVIAGWATTDPEAAKAWIAGQEDGREKMMYMNGLIEGLAKSDPAAATAFVLAMEAPQEGADGAGGFDMRSRYISNITNEMLKQGVEAAATWANGLPEGTLKASALGQVAEYYARQDPAAAAKWIEAYAGSADASGAIGEIADRWARDSPADAAKWLVALPGEAQGAALRSVFAEWVGAEPLEASQYLAAMEASPSRDSAVSGFSRQLAGEDPTAAMQWAGSIADEEMRQRAEIGVAREWYRAEPDAATAWAQENLPAESQEAITQPGREGFDRGGFGPGGFGGGGPGGRGGR